MVRLVIFAALTGCWVAWAFATWRWLDRAAWQKILLIVLVPLSWPLVVLLAKGQTRIAFELLLIAPPACIVGLIAGAIVRYASGRKSAAGWTAVGTVMLIGFANPWTSEAIADGLAYKRSMRHRDIAVTATDEATRMLRVPLAYISDQDMRAVPSRTNVSWCASMLPPDLACEASSRTSPANVPIRAGCGWRRMLPMSDGSHAATPTMAPDGCADANAPRRMCRSDTCTWSEIRRPSRQIGST